MPISLSNHVKHPCFTAQDIDNLEDLLSTSFIDALNFARYLHMFADVNAGGDDVFAIERAIIELEDLVSGKSDDILPMQDIISDCREILAS